MQGVLRLKMDELKSELVNRGLSTNGDKPVLQARLLEHNEKTYGVKDAGSSSSGMRKRKRADAEEDTAKSLLTELECPVCAHLITPPIFQCEAGHLICEGCRKALSFPKRCPTCRGPLGSTRCLAMEKVARDLAVPCPHEGCEAVIQYEDYAKHIATCDFRTVKCPKRSCTWIGGIQEIPEHFELHHKKQTHAKLTCGLKTVFSFNTESEHQKRMTISFLQTDKEWSFIQCSRLDQEGFFSSLVFVGPEKQRKLCRWKMQCENDISSMTWEAVPASVHEFDGDAKQQDQIFGQDAHTCFVLNRKQLQRFNESAGTLQFQLSFQETPSS